MIKHWISLNGGTPYMVAEEQYVFLHLQCALGGSNDPLNWRGLTPATKTPIRGWVEPQPNVAALEKRNQAAAK